MSKKLHLNFHQNIAKPSIFSTGAFMNRNILATNKSQHAKTTYIMFCDEWDYTLSFNSWLKVNRQIFHLLIVLFSIIFRFKFYIKKKICLHVFLSTEISWMNFNLFITNKRRTFPWRPVNTVPSYHENLLIKIFFFVAIHFEFLFLFFTFCE